MRIEHNEIKKTEFAMQQGYHLIYKASMILSRIVRLFNYYFIPALPLTINDECMHFSTGTLATRLRLIDRDSTYDYDACKQMPKFTSKKRKIAVFCSAILFASALRLVILFTLFV